MKKAFIAGLAASLFGLSTSNSVVNEFKNFERHFSPKQPKQNGWRDSQPSEYFGQRSKIVIASTPRGERKMKLKNALKGGYQFQII
ncbi:hypothetical protein [Soonwooa sp.]|uniref:hypothetical protein n=1 Tax=Soonwooa sp. TaxID=1938592 RepID=UPI0028ABB6C6|nr:hypothetical protein [Soonwooa sp.]